MQENLTTHSPIFVVGMPRSGTTLMNTILSAHPSIAIPLSETKFVIELDKANPHWEQSKSKDLATFLEAYLQGERFAKLDLDADMVRSRVLAAGDPSYQSIFASILQEYAIKMNKLRWGEKTPDHYRYIDVLLDWYPQARIIWMVRDPRAVVASLLKVSWSKGSIEGFARRWCKSVDIFEQRWANDERIKLVRYELLVSSPASELQPICQFLNEEFVSTMVADRSESTSPIINRTQEDKKFFQQTLRPVDQKSLEKWRTGLSPAQIATVESITRSRMLQYQYQPTTEWLNKQAVRLWVDRVSRKVKYLAGAGWLKKRKPSL